MSTLWGSIFCPEKKRSHRSYAYTHKHILVFPRVELDILPLFPAMHRRTQTWWRWMELFDPICLSQLSFADTWTTSASAAVDFPTVKYSKCNAPREVVPFCAVSREIYSPRSVVFSLPSPPIQLER